MEGMKNNGFYYETNVKVTGYIVARMCSEVKMRISGNTIHVMYAEVYIYCGRYAQRTLDQTQYKLFNSIGIMTTIRNYGHFIVVSTLPEIRKRPFVRLG